MQHLNDVTRPHHQRVRRIVEEGCHGQPHDPKKRSNRGREEEEEEEEATHCLEGRGVRRSQDGRRETP